MTVRLSETRRMSGEGKQNELCGVNTALASVQRSPLLQAVSTSRVKKCHSPRTIHSSYKQLVAWKLKKLQTSHALFIKWIFTHNHVALDTISCSDLKALVVYISRFYMAHSLLLSLVTTAPLSVSPPVQRAHDWSIFLYLIAGDEQKWASAWVFQVVGVGLKSVAVC